MNSPGIVSFTPFNVIYRMIIEKDKIKDIREQYQESSYNVGIPDNEIN